MLNVLIPMAGTGKRFVEAGYQLPKPLIGVLGKPMIERAMEPIINGLTVAGIEYRLIFVILHELNVTIPVRDHLHITYPGCVTVSTPRTDGAARTCLTVKRYIDTDDPLLIANCDQIVHPESVAALVSSLPDAAVLTMLADGTNKWSYAEVDGDDVIRVKEKEPISDRATCGLYWWHKGSLFVENAEKMIAADERVNGEFYVAPVLDVTIREGYDVSEVRIEEHGNEFYGLGTPEDLEKFVALCGTKK